MTSIVRQLNKVVKAHTDSSDALRKVFIAASLAIFTETPLSIQREIIRFHVASDITFLLMARLVSPSSKHTGKEKREV